MATTATRSESGPQCAYQSCSEWTGESLAQWWRYLVCDDGSNAMATALQAAGWPRGAGRTPDWALTRSGLAGMPNGFDTARLAQLNGMILFEVNMYAGIANTGAMGITPEV
ncbi:hypothetical protein EDB92DRAFT_1818939 [Lactarius akahatsu]|uniref:Uncharacterized protein n=1 Tax=Lactarius akahatsu TaxID=416441 RepID=A0AAD4LCU8_9AGAM|nr:hypothetical protein EDB92DRAFT_1818939 [Lactarius akahatsu]